jgi:hypothetical protein
VTIAIIMTRKNEILLKLEPKVGDVYSDLDYINNKLAKLFPIWFMVKRFVFVLIVFNF